MLALGACGSSYEGLSKAEFVSKATAICVENEGKLGAIGASIGNSPSVEALKDAYAKQLFPLLEDEVDQLRALKPPKEDREEVSKILDDLSKGIDQAAAQIKSLRSTKELGSLSTPPALKAANAEARAYGLAACADTGG